MRVLFVWFYTKLSFLGSDVPFCLPTTPIRQWIVINWAKNNNDYIFLKNLFINYGVILFNFSFLTVSWKIRGDFLSTEVLFSISLNHLSCHFSVMRNVTVLKMTTFMLTRAWQEQVEFRNWAAIKAQNVTTVLNSRLHNILKHAA